MTVSTERRGDITVAALSGEVDLNRAPEEIGRAHV